jgi:hypothetical protein
VPLKNGKSRLVLSGRSVCAGSWNESPLCVDPATGDVSWRSDFGGAQLRDLGDGVVLAWKGTMLRVLDADSGRLLRHTELDQTPRDLLNLPDERLVVVALPDSVLGLRW